MVSERGQKSSEIEKENFKFAFADRVAELTEPLFSQQVTLENVYMVNSDESGATLFTFN